MAGKTPPKGTKGAKTEELNSKSKSFRFPPQLLVVLAAEAEKVDMSATDLAKRLLRRGIREVRRDRAILVSDDCLKEVELES